MKFLAWTYSILEMIYSASINTVLTDNFLLHMVNKSSKEWPSKSITIILKSPSFPYQYTYGIPTSVKQTK